MADEEPTVQIQQGEIDPLAKYIENLLQQATAGNVATGILHWSYVMPYAIADFNGAESPVVCDQPTWMQLYTDLFNGQKREVGLASDDALQGMLSEYHEQNQVPIAIAYFNYDTPQPTVIAAAITAAQRNEAPPALAEVLEQRTAFFSSALLRNRSHGFELLPHVHFGLDVQFIVPRKLFFTSVAVAGSAIEIDFGDGRGFQTVPFDQPVDVHYGNEEPKQIAIRTAAGGNALNAAFKFQAIPVAAPIHGPRETWRLKSVEPYKGVTATGTAWVFYGEGHTGITDPMLFADGFGEGATDLNTIWSQLDQKYLATNLLGHGKDLIIIGYDNKTQYVQANALLAVNAIETAIAKRTGTTPLLIGGASMGGLVMRYAMNWMESRNRPHQAAKYLSFDTPHDGAWLPVILQYFAYYFEKTNARVKRFANLLRSPAAQQLLWGWVPAWDYKGSFTNNRLRAEMNADLAGRMPNVKRYAVSNGRDNGDGNGVPPGEEAFNWDFSVAGVPVAGARPHTEPNAGKEMPLGDMRLLTYHDYYTATDVPPFDGAPGGAARFFGEAGEALEDCGYGHTQIFHRGCCFVPSVSALATNHMYDPYAEIATMPRESIPFDEYLCTPNNQVHVQVTAETAAWILDRFGVKPTEAEQPAVEAPALATV